MRFRPKSEDLKAFDLSMESADVREKYGRDRFGQGALLARRLIEHGVRFAEVQMGGWDMHNLVDQGMSTKGANMDRVFAALIEDLESKGLLETTLIVMGSEFGRTPDINMNDGRTPPDFIATIGHAMGLPTEEVVMSPTGRPFTVGDKGEPVTGVFA
jgi:hypothetical protein